MYSQEANGIITVEREKMISGEEKKRENVRENVCERDLDGLEVRLLLQC